VEEDRQQDFDQKLHVSYYGPCRGPLQAVVAGSPDPGGVIGFRLDC